jgi:hypothetical protein
VNLCGSDKEGAAPTWKKGYGFHPLGAWCRNTRECLAMLLRPGNAGSNTFTDHNAMVIRLGTAAGKFDETGTAKAARDHAAMVAEATRQGTWTTNEDTPRAGA